MKRFILLVALLALSSGSAFAEWVAADQRYQSPGLRTLYLDPTTIQRDGNLVTIATLMDWKWMQGNRSPTRFYSTKIKKQFDCAEKHVRILALTDYYGHMGTGRSAPGFGGEGDWTSIEPDSLDQALENVACSSK